MDEIEVIHKPGTTLVAAQIGPHGVVFEIRVVDERRVEKVREGRKLVERLATDRSFAYYVDDVRVSAEAYRDALATANMDEYCKCGQCDALPDSPVETEPS